MSYIPGSFFHSVDDRLSQLEGDTPETLNSRVSSLETWRNNKSGEITDLSYSVSSDAVTILNISVPTAAAFSGHTTALNDLKTKVNGVISALRSREIIAT